MCLNCDCIRDIESFEAQVDTLSAKLKQPFQTQAHAAELYGGILMTLVAIITLLPIVSVYLLQTARSSRPDTSGRRSHTS
jgi:1,4-dihydroxy-2-naphthoate octaprenyltransferase